MISRKNLSIAGLFLFAGLNMISEMTMASNKSVEKKTIQSPMSIKCSFFAIDENDKSFLLETEEFSLSDLQQMSPDRKKGTTVNLFDFVDFNFSFDSSKNVFVINIHEEENLKRTIRKFPKVPFKLKSAISFSAHRNKKNVYIEEVSVVCNT